ncbi:DHA2 family efflux MFS transporter permease subunit [Sphingomonas sp. MMS24-J13]|uniref:DHA2 family efflux MFS transporter permease subunit n=1 Tax=Sphingomonas sp. MMS24-J13 TaxID=3238686 RepID=UPI00384F0E76
MASPHPAATPSDVAALPVDAARRNILMTLVIAATVMQVLDQTIANVALPHMQGSLGAAPDTISWVLTSYIVASAVATPVTGWLSDKMGRRNLMIMTVAGFTAASALCAVSISLPMMVGARLLQGTFGAFIIPAGQALMLDINPKSRHPQAMTIWGLAAMVAPVMGPVLGGWLTDTFDWRWVFMINVPIGVLALIGLLIFMPRAPIVASRFDMTGFGFLFIAIASFQLMLDRGQQNDWFESTETIVEAALAFTGGAAFLIHTLTTPDPLLPVAIFRDRNLVISCLFILMVVGLVMASSALIPQLLQSLMGYDAYGAGLVTMPRGVAMAASMLFGGRLARMVDRRAIILFGMILTAISMHMMMGATLDMSGRLIVISGIVQGFGFGCVFLPLNLMAFGTLDPHYRTQGAGLYSLARSLSGSIAISLMSSLVARQVQISHADLAQHITLGASALLGPAMRAASGMAPGSAMLMVDGEVNRQATMIAYIDAFTVMFWFCLIAAPLILFLRTAPTRQATPEEAGHAMAME